MRKIKIKIISLCIVVVLFVSVSWYYVSRPDYYIRFSMANSSGEGSSRRRDIELEVIAPKFYLNTEELFERIRTEHDEVNGKPTTLEIKLYRSSWHYRQNKQFAHKEYTYEK